MLICSRTSLHSGAVVVEVTSYPRPPRSPPNSLLARTVLFFRTRTNFPSCLLIYSIKNWCYFFSDTTSIHTVLCAVAAGGCTTWQGIRSWPLWSLARPVAFQYRRSRPFNPAHSLHVKQISSILCEVPRLGVWPCGSGPRYDLAVMNLNVWLSQTFRTWPPKNSLLNADFLPFYFFRYFKDLHIYAWPCQDTLHQS